MADLPEPLDPRQMRASDADRERVAEVLRTAVVEGRLDLNEVDDRLKAVYAARTYADLEPITRDLPIPLAAVPPVPASAPLAPVRPGEATDVGSAVAVMSGFMRNGSWVPPRVLNCVAFWGGGLVDLREARFLHAEIEIHVVAIMGGVEIVVPEDADVQITGSGVMGGFDHGASGTGQPGAPRVVVTGFAFWGGVAVKRLARGVKLDHDHKD
jgi:Domain of unknown function (DUF1707)